MKTPFRDLKVGDCFSCGRVLYRKRSSRTAEFFADSKMWFYFHFNEPVFKV